MTQNCTGQAAAKSRASRSRAGFSSEKKSVILAVEDVALAVHVIGVFPEYGAIAERVSFTAISTVTRNAEPKVSVPKVTGLELKLLISPASTASTPDELELIGIRVRVVEFV